MQALGKRPVSREEARLAFKGGDEAPFTSGVPHHTPPALVVSHTLLLKDGSLRDGLSVIIRGWQPCHHNLYTHTHTGNYLL